MTFKYRVIITNRHLTIIETLLLTTSFQLNTLTARDIMLKHNYGLNLTNYYTNEMIMAITFIISLSYRYFARDAILLCAINIHFHPMNKII